MKDLTTRKIVLGMLMVLVLAFSVQGNLADAQTLSVSGDGTADTADSGIQFIESTQSTSRRSFNIAVNGAKNGQNISIAYPTNTIAGTVVIPTSPAGASNNGGTTSITFTAVDPSDDNTVITNAEQEAWSWSGTIKVNYMVTAYGQFRVTVTRGGSPAWTGDDPDPITAYLVRDRVESRFATFTGSPATLAKNSSRSAIDISLTTTAWTKVDFSISAGSGTLYLGATGSYVSGDKLYPTFTTGSTSFSTYTNGSNAVSVQFEATADTTATVRAQIPGATSSDGTHEVTVFYNNSVRVERISGNNQFGPANSNTLAVEDRQQLSNPLVVQVLDGTRGVGQKQGKVTFTVTAPSGTTDGTLRYFSRNLFADETGSEQDTKSVIVYTDSSGYAKAYLVLGTSAAEHTVTATMDGQSVTFAATATQAINTGPNYRIDKGDSTSTPQVGARYGNPSSPLPMIVNVDNSGGSDAANVQVHFEVTGGRIYLAPSTLDLAQPNYQNALSTVTGTTGNATVYVEANRNSTATVTARIAGNYNEDGRHVVTYFYDNVNLEYVSVNIQEGVKGTQLKEPLVVRIIDGPSGGPVPGQIVKFSVADSTATESDGIAGQVERKFVPIIDTTVYVTTRGGNTLSKDSDLNNRPDTTNANDPLYTFVATPISPTPGDPIFIQTDSQGQAQVYLLLGTGDDNHRVTVQTPASSDFEIFTAVANDASDAASIEKFSGDGQSAAVNQTLDEPLIVVVKDLTGQIVPGVEVRFTTDSGAISNPSASKGDPGNSPMPIVTASLRGIRVETDRTGRASVRYNVGNVPGAKRIHTTITAYDGETRRETFNINGSGTQQQDQQQDQQQQNQQDQQPTLTVGRTSITGRPGSSQQIAITASQTAQVGNFFDRFLEAGGSVSPSSGSGTFTATLTLPSTEGQYDLTVSMAGLTRTVTVTVSSTAAVTPTGGTVRVSSITPGSGAPGTTSVVTVAATDANENPVANVVVTLTITAGGGTFSQSPVTTGANGIATSTLTRGSTLGSNYFIKASASGYTFSGPAAGERVTIAGAQSAGGGSTPREAGEADSIDVYDGNNQRGTPNSRLAEPLVVEVVDANNRPVSRERVTFRTTRGSGQFSPERPRTNASGRAQTRFTPTSSGDIRITATATGVASRAVFNVTTGAAPASLTKVSGDTQSGTPDSALANPFVVEVKDEDGEAIEGLRVSFSVTAGGGSLSETSATADEDGRAETTLTLGSERGVNSVQASVTGVDAVTFSTSIEPKVLVAAANRPAMYWIDNGMLYGLAGAKAAKIAESANGVAVGGGKIYWTEMTGERGGTVNSANLDGDPDVTELASIFATPIGIAVDAAGSKLYWTNASGRIQSANLDGSRIQNVLQNLSNPTDIVVSNGFIYWTEDGNSVRRVNISGQKIVRDVAVNLATVGGLAVGGGKVYWTEQTSATAGTVNGANLNGTNFETLATLLSAPMGISVDTAGSKLYWTNARGRVQSANLNGSRIKNVVEGLISPSALAIGGANTETTAARTTTPAKKDNAAYDVNEDDTVDNMDAGLVADALGTSNAAYDVNGDGKVNFLDLLLVFDNRDDNAAAAPTIVGMKLTAIQIERIQEQIDLLVATNDRSPAALRTLVYLQQLLVTARPEKTQLFANYPNPFNPETWIPYELATDTQVTITIYNTQGVVIRTLQFGHQSAGYYTDRDRAAYWDGRNALGEQVASGLYFYQLETDEMSSMRKMVILK